jgi:hypothetical protein
MKSLRIGLLVAGVLLAALASASTRIYDVDARYRQEVLEILQELLNPDRPGLELQRGGVSLLPTGQLLVDTVTDERQAEVAAILESIASNEPEPTPTVTLRYWMLHGEPGGRNAEGLPATLEDVVRELEAVHGPLGVSILSAATVSGRSGQVAIFENDRWGIEQMAVVSGEGDRLNARVIVENQFQGLEVDLALTKGEFVVLGGGSSDQISENGVAAMVVNWPED